MASAKLQGSAGRIASHSSHGQSGAFPERRKEGSSFLERLSRREFHEAALPRDPNRRPEEFRDREEHVTSRSERSASPFDRSVSTKIENPFGSIGNIGEILETAVTEHPEDEEYCKSSQPQTFRGLEKPLWEVESLKNLSNQHRLELEWQDIKFCFQKTEEIRVRYKECKYIEPDIQHTLVLIAMNLAKRNEAASEVAATPERRSESDSLARRPGIKNCPVSEVDSMLLRKSSDSPLWWPSLLAGDSEPREEG
ncbi:hypothetical protein WN51_05945 [Melipona quadrifasciata]|uniref:Uncharacterized protein n=1 Tax=Melipona quadrifasciata TaxID=166423 RepID=A0A0M9A673_9HYME|nr:hypothetical protein WN51_05945 [Melipona quadrifasciata]